MEIWSRAAFRALEECRIAMEARKASERPKNGSEKLKKEPAANRGGSAQAAGSYTTGGGLGGDHADDPAGAGRPGRELPLHHRR